MQTAFSNDHIFWHFPLQMVKAKNKNMKEVRVQEIYNIGKTGKGKAAPVNNGSQLISSQNSTQGGNRDFRNHKLEGDRLH